MRPIRTSFFLLSLSPYLGDSQTCLVAHFQFPDQSLLLLKTTTVGRRGRLAISIMRQGGKQEGKRYISHSQSYLLLYVEKRERKHETETGNTLKERKEEQCQARGFMSREMRNRCTFFSRGCCTDRVQDVMTFEILFHYRI